MNGPCYAMVAVTRLFAKPPPVEQNWSKSGGPRLMKSSSHELRGLQLRRRPGCKQESMRSPIQAIAWEMCARSRWHLCLAFGPVMLVLFVEWILPIGREGATILQVFSCMVTFVTLVWISSFTAGDGRGLFGGFPSHLYTMPLRTVSLVLFPMFVALGLIAAAIIIWEIVICLYWALPLEPVRLCWHLLVGVTTVACCQAAIWCLHRHRWTRIISLVVLIYGALFAALFSAVLKFPGGAWIWFGGITVVLAAVVVSAVIGVERDRRGHGSRWTTRLLEYLIDLVPRRAGSFANAARAQFWFDWRRRGLFFSLAFGFLMAITLVVVPLPAALYAGPLPRLLIFLVPFTCLGFFMSLAGAALAKSDPWSGELALHQLIATRPITTAHLVFSKMKVAAVITVCGIFVFGMLAIPVMLWTSQHDWPNEEACHFWADLPANFPRLWHWITRPVVIVALVAVTWHSTIPALCVTLTGNKRRIQLESWKGVIFLSLTAGLGGWLLMPQHYASLRIALESLPWLTTLLFMVKLLAALLCFRALRGIVSIPHLCLIAAMWLGIASLVLCAGFVADATHGMPPALLWFLVAFFYLPAGEIPAAFVALHGNRHL